MTFKVKGSISSVDSILMGGVVFDNEKLPNSKNMPKNKFTINEIDSSDSTDLANNTLVTNFGKSDDISGMLSFNTGDWKNSDSKPVKLMMRVVNKGNDSNWVTIFDSSKTTVTWSSIATAGQTTFTVPNLDYKSSVVFVNGILQEPGVSYTTYGGTITFTNKLDINDQLYVLVGENSSSTEITYESFVATAGQTTITLSNKTASNNMLYVNGVFQYPSTYSISSGVITLNSELDLNDNIYVVSNNLSIQSSLFTASEDQLDFTLTSVPKDPYVYINGVLQYDNSYTVTGTTLSFITGLNANDSVFVYYNYPKFIDDVSATYIKNIENDEESKSLNIPYFHFSELQVFINGVLQNPDNGAYTLKGTEVTLSSGLQVNDDIHVIVYNSPVQSDNFLTKADLSSYASQEELTFLRNSLANEGINLKWNAHLPSIEVAFGLPRRSLQIWEPGSTGTNSKYWLYPVTGTVWTGIGTLGDVPNVPFYQLSSNKEVITWTYTAESDNINTIYVPYTFGTITIFINGVLQSYELGHYTFSGQYITLNGALQTGDNLIAILGKIVFNSNPYLTSASANNTYVSKSSLLDAAAATFIGTNDGILQTVLDEKINYDDLTSNVVKYSPNNNISRYVYDALQDFVNLHDYYDKNNDNNDWSYAFTRAFNVSYNILIPFGEHVVNSTINIPPNAKIIGLGAASIVKSPASIDSNGSNLITVFRGSSVNNILISNLTVDGGVIETNTVKNYTRTMRFTNCNNIYIDNIWLLNNADWSLSFEGGSNIIVKNYIQRSYVYNDTSVNLNGGRDGLHFMDCSNVYACNLDIESGDDCVGITTTGTDMSNITIKGLRGTSNIASLVIFNEEQDSSGNYYSNTLTNLNISDIIVKPSGKARNIVRVIGYNTNTIIKDVSITDIKGTAYNSYGVWIQRVSNIFCNNIDVYSSRAHGIYLNIVSKISGSMSGGYNGDNSSASFAGINVVSLSNSTISLCSSASYGYGVQISSSSDCTIIPDIYNCGYGLFSVNAGGNLRIVNSTNINIPYGRAVGSTSQSYYGFNQSGNTNLEIGLDFIFSGYSNSVLPTSYYLRKPVVDVKFKEDSTGTIINHLLYGATFVRNSVGNYTITFSTAMRSTNFSWTATAYRNGALVFVRLASAVGTSSITLQVVDSSNVATYADHIEFKAYNT